MAQAPVIIPRDETHKGFIDLDRNELRNVRLQNSITDIAAPANGLFFYRSDTHKVRGYINGAWTDIATMADVTAGGISSSIVDLKGDLIVATADNTVVRQAVGADGTLLVAATAQTNGVQWRALLDADIPATLQRTSTAVADGDAAGGDLAGTYPNPTIAANIIVNADINTAAAIARTKLDFGTGLVNADISTSAGIAYSKLNLATSIVNADVAAVAAIAATKLAFTPAQNIAATNVQAAIEELKTDMDAAMTAATEAKDWKDPVEVTSTVQRALTGLTAIDGYMPVAGDRILLIGQTAASENGIWIAAAGAWTRALDADSTADLVNATTLAINGTTTKGDVYTQTANVVTVGTTAQTWTKTGEGNTVYTGSGGVTLTGTNFDTTLSGLGSGRTAGDLPYASATAAVSWLPGAAATNVLRSNGAAAPSWGKVVLTTDVSGVLPIANGGTGAVDAAAARTSLGAIGKAAGALTGGTNSEVLNHNLNTRDIVNVKLINNLTPFDAWGEPYWEATTVNTITIYAGSGLTLPAGFRWVVAG